MPSAELDDIDVLLTRVAEQPTERVRALHHLLGDGPCRQLGIYPIPADFKLSVVIPVFNERDWVRELMRRVQAVPIPKEIIVVDDGSTDGTRDILRELGDAHENVRVVLHAANQGKGAALRTGFAHATGDAVLVQDADLEYDPAEYPRLLQPIIENRADVVYGSRFIGESHRVLYFWHSVANRPHRHGDLLQGLPPRRAERNPPEVGAIRLRARNYREDQPRPALARVRDPDQLLRPHV
jgi:glycosyltransferase involved in cell wall biosynthesis